MATREELIAFVRRDWGAAARVAKTQRATPREALELADALGEHGLAVGRPPTKAERRADLATHRRVHEALTRVGAR